ncbi:MAG: DUF3108 domain-containing protein [Hyphomicrobiaceae bacterium]|jgi:hypothetical protein
MASKRVLSTAAGFLLVLISCAGARAETWPAEVRAVYDVNFNGLNVGTFEFRSDTDGRTYTLQANAQLSVWLYKWNGQTRSSGRILNQGPHPAAFTFDFKSDSKVGSARSGSLMMGFNGDAVTNVTHVPPAKIKPGTVPVTEANLKNVLDPMSAVLAMSRGSTANPCGRRLPIFDGKQRFDLLLTYRGQTNVTEQQPSGQPGTAYICRVRYIPIAGHKQDDETRFMAQSNDIEIVLRPVPSANVFVPYQINIPTMAGTASLVAKRVDITTPSRQAIALVY